MDLRISNTIKIPSSVTIDVIESLLQELADARGEVSLRLPALTNNLGVDGEVSLVQFLLTWAQSQEWRNIQLYLSDISPERIEQFNRRIFGLVASLASTEMMTRSEPSDATEAFKAIALERLTKLQGVNPSAATRGTALEVVAVDHINRGEPAFLYKPTGNGNRELRPRDHYVRLARYLINQTVPTNTGKILASKGERPIGNLLYEIVKNTQDHALKNLDGDALPLSFRLVRASQLEIGGESLVRASEGYTPFSEFSKRLYEGLRSPNANLFVVSVLDSGPGFAQTLSGKSFVNLPIEEELATTIECFSKKTTKMGDRFGRGLPLVASLIHECRGFLRLRTGRTSLFYDPAVHGPIDNDRVPLESWLPEKDNPPAPVAGALISFIIPLERAE